MNQGKTINTTEFQQPYTPDTPYQYEALANDLRGLADTAGASQIIQGLER